jgi:PAS domain S-box-containing protein
MSEPEPSTEFTEFHLKLRGLTEASHILAEAASFDEFCRLAVELGRETLHLDRMGLWFFDTDPRFLVGSFGTDEQGQTRDERHCRYEVSFDEWILELFNTRAIRAKRRHTPLYNDKHELVGWGESAITALWDGERRLGWLTADNLIHQKPITDYQVELMALYGATISQLASRKRAEEALRRSEQAARQFQAKLKALHEVSIELSKTTSFDELCRRAVELGRQTLGFDRLALFFLDNNDSHTAIGSFGTDEHANTRDERTCRTTWSFDGMQSILDGRVLITVQPEAPLYNHRSEVVGHGWNAAALVRDGGRFIGWLTADNLFSKEPLTDYQAELLALYAATLGPLTAIRKAEEALAAERNLLRTIIDAVPDFIAVKDAAGRFVLVNKASWENTPGASSEQDLIGKSDFDIFPNELAKRYWTDDQKIITSGIPLINNREPGRDHSRPVFLITTKVPLRDANNRVTGLVSVARDITELQQAEMQILDLAVERERVKALRQFITNISHDLRTPLTIINSGLYLLDHLTDPEMQKSKIESIKHQTLLLTHFIEEILTSSRLENAAIAPRDPNNLNQIVHRVTEYLCSEAEKKNLTIEKSLQPGLPSILGEEVELLRLLSNLLHNAIRYTPEHGTITLKTYTDTDTDKVVLEVSDTGIGIGESDLSRIFEHFFRVDSARSMDQSGTGLGLSIAKRIVEIHNGTIEVDSIVGQGTTFQVSFPIYQQNEASSS